MLLGEDDLIIFHHDATIVEVLLEVFLKHKSLSKVTWHKEIKNTPNFHEVVLNWGARKDEFMFCLYLLYCHSNSIKRVRKYGKQ